MSKVGWGALAIAAAGVIGACGSGDGAARGLGSFEAALAQLPRTELAPGDMVTWADLDEISDALDLGRPDGSSWEEIDDWTAAIAFDREAPIAVQLPRTVQILTEARSPEDFHDEHGWSIADVDELVELFGPDGTFFVAAGDLAIDPDRTEAVAEGIRGTLGGDGLLMAERDDLLAAASETAPLERWLGGTEDTLVDDDAVAAVAAALDADDVVSAVVARYGLIETPWRFDTVGIGWRADDGTARITIAFRVVDVDPDDAARALEAAMRDGEVGDRPFADYLVLDDVRADGDVVTATVAPGPRGAARTPLDLLRGAELPFRDR